MNHETRIKRIESAAKKRESDARQFVQRITRDGVKYFIDGVEVDAAIFARECYRRGAQDERIAVDILGFDAIAE
jgi:hypothetical protein